MKNLHIILTFILIFNCTANSQIKKLNEDESVRIAFENSKDIKIAESRIKSSLAKIDETSSLFLPQLKFNAGYTRYSKVNPFLIKVPAFPEPLKLSEVLNNSYNFRLSLTQPLFTGNKLTSLKSSATSMEKSAGEDLLNEKNNTASAVRIAFWNYYKAGLLKDIAAENVAQSEIHVNDTRNFLKNGLATNSDVLKLEVQLSNSKLQYLETSNNLELARVSFNKTLGLPLDSKTDPEVINPEFSEMNFDLKKLTDEALINRRELKSSDFKLKSLESNIDAIKSSYYPYIYLGANYALLNPNNRVLPQVNRFELAWDAGLYLSWDLWNWGNTSAQVTQAEQNLVQSRQNRSQLKDAIELEVNQYFHNVNFLKEKIIVSRKSIEQSEENYRVIREKYNFQLATSTELTDAENLLFQAKINYASAVADYNIALIKLFKSAGRRLYP